eukprot:1776123-Amphidinium_carterae.1
MAAIFCPKGKSLEPKWLRARTCANMTPLHREGCLSACWIKVSRTNRKAVHYGGGSLRKSQPNFHYYRNTSTP